MVGYIKFLQRRGKITTRYKKLIYFVTPVRKARLQVFLLLFAPFGDDWREYCSYPQVPFPSVIPPAVIESWPPSGTGGYLQNLIFYTIFASRKIFSSPLYDDIMRNGIAV